MESPYIELSFRPNAALVSTVRRFVSELYSRTVGNSRAMSQIALATHELLENAVKYSIDGETRLRIEIDVSQNPRRVHIEMRNRAEPAHIAAVKGIVDAITEADDPGVFYRSLIVETESREGSGLGLARICAEAEMTLSCTVEGDVVVLAGVAHIYQVEGERAA